MFVALASTAALTDPFRSDGPSAIADVEAYVASVNARTTMRVAVLDDGDSMRFFGLPPTQDRQPVTIRDVIQRIRDELARRGDALDGIFLLGGDDVFPFWQFGNPVADRLLDPDPIVLSDNPYGLCADPESLVPTVPVGRLYASSPDEFRTALSALGDGTTGPAAVGSLSAVNVDWIRASASAMSALEPPLDERVCPHYEVTVDNAADLHRRFLYFNLHGFDGDPAWKGYDASVDAFEDAVTPGSFTARPMAGAMIVSEACYGAQVAGRSADNSCALAAHMNGAAAFIGATGLVFGSFLQPTLTVADADKLAPMVLQHLVARVPAGRALVDARRAFVTTPARDLTPYEKKTALQFVLLGDPSRLAD
jgi:hypothetical protein